MNATPIEVVSLTKRYGRTLAVDDLSFTVRPGVVTGFLGPNGAGKTTTMRMILGLDRPTSGTVRIGGRPYEELSEPMRAVGGLLDAGWVHPRRSARSHLRWLAALGGLPSSRVDEVLDLVGLASVAGKRAGTFSLGMRQRLGIAAALLGDPGVLLLDEPVNGLDPEGVTWIRGLLQWLAAEGRTVLVSSHLIAEMALTASEVVVVGRGRLIAQASTAELIGRAPAQVRVRCSNPAALAAALRAAGLRPAPDAAGLCVPDVTTDQVGHIAAGCGVVVFELAAQQASLESAFLKLTRNATEFVSGGGGVNSVIRLLRAERIKLTSTRAAWWCGGLTVALVAGMMSLIAGLAPEMGRVSESVPYVARLGYPLVLVSAALAITGDIRYGTLRTTFLAVPRRTPALLAKAAVVAVWSGLLGLVVAFGSWAVGVLVAPSADAALSTPADWRAVAGVGLAYAVAAAIGVGVGVLLRHAAGAVALLLCWLLAEIVAQTSATANRILEPWLPFTVLNRFTSVDLGGPTPGRSIFAERLLFGPWTALAYATAIAVAVLAAGLVVARRRDA